MMSQSSWKIGIRRLNYSFKFQIKWRKKIPEGGVLFDTGWRNRLNRALLDRELQQCWNEVKMWFGAQRGSVAVGMERNILFYIEQRKIMKGKKTTFVFTVFLRLGFRAGGKWRLATETRGTHLSFRPMEELPQLVWMIHDIFNISTRTKQSGFAWLDESGDYWLSKQSSSTVSRSF